MKKINNIKTKRISEILKDNNFQIYTMDIPANINYKFVGFVQDNQAEALNIGTSFLTGFKQMIGGSLPFISELLFRTREKAILNLVKDSIEMGANAIIGMRVDLSIITNSVAVYAYATAITIAEKDLV